MIIHLKTEAAIVTIIMMLVLVACSNGKENIPGQNAVTPEVTISADKENNENDTQNKSENNDKNNSQTGNETTDINNAPDIDENGNKNNTQNENGTNDKATDQNSTENGDKTNPQGEIENEKSQNNGTGSWEGSRFISLHRTFSSKGGELELILTGLTRDSAAYVLDALKDFDPDDDTPFRLENDEFVDAEKWNVISDTQDDDNDSNQCWAASVSNILLISGWTEGHNDTVNGKSFDSEDTIFEYYNAKITNRGCDVKQALGWFFTGEFAPDWESSHPAMLVDDPDPADGIIKDFVITSALNEYSIADDIMLIAELENLDMNSSKTAVFEGSIGFLQDGDELTKSEHSLTVVGIITDPNAQNESERYKAIILADSDNDGYPDDSFENIDEMTLEEKNADKEARPNSYTVYKLNLGKDANGKEYWDILGYSEERHTVLYTVVGLPMVSEDLVDEFRETEGSCSVIDDPDFIPGKMFTTSNTESVMDPILFDKDKVIRTVFEQGEAVNLNFFITNISFVDFDPEQYENAILAADWKVISEDGSIMASGRAECNEMIYSSLFGGCLVELNTVDGEVKNWPAGKYTVTVAVNTDHAIKEAYYLNNGEAECTFEIR
ncbi:MAG: hypothetical protein K6E85_06770 [Lachnospiraceae bacterium]|nr:hypothetical protein [Lachnospiraceae bacterium]